jgi:hypothetical protein
LNERINKQQLGQVEFQNLRDAGVERLRGDLGGKPRAKRLALVSRCDALTAATAAKRARTAVNFIVTARAKERQFCEGETNRMKKLEAVTYLCLMYFYLFYSRQKHMHDSPVSES